MPKIFQHVEMNISASSQTPKTSQGTLPVDALTLLALFAFTFLSLSIHPLGFYGSGYDDERYVQAAIRWLQDFPYLGNTHWALRHPYNILLAVAFSALGVTQEAAVIASDIPIFALVAITYFAVRTLFGRTTAALACALIASCPVIARGAVAIEPLELLLAVSSVWCFVLAARHSRPDLLLTLSGITLGLAWQTRETSGALILLYGLSFLFFPIVPRRHYTFLAAGAAAPIVLEMIFYFLKAGDAFYRYFVDANHIHVSKSSQMLNRTIDYGIPLFNFTIARSWQPADDFFRVNWIVAPYAALFLNPKSGPVALTSISGLLTWSSEGHPRLRSPLTIFLIGGLVWFLFATYVLTIRPEPRYYIFTIYTAAIFAAFGIVNLWKATRALIALALLIATFAANVVFTDLGERNEEAYAFISYLRLHPLNVYIPDALRSHFDVDHRDARLSAYILKQPKTGALALSLGRTCPASSVWCSSPAPSMISIILTDMGFQHLFSANAWQRIERQRPVAALTPIG